MDFNHLVFFPLAVYINCIPSIFLFLNLVYVCRCVGYVCVVICVEVRE